ncbi:MAG TPA: HAD hydrolase family protein, partial [Candidatus Aquilonibacter sp.]
MVPIQLIALDLDGTLLDSSERITPASRAAIRQAQALGAHIVLITGRGADAPLSFGRDLGLRDPIVCAHGALTKECPSARELRHIAIPREHATPLIEFAQHAGLDTAVYTGERFHRLAGSPRHMDDMRGPQWV